MAPASHQISDDMTSIRVVYEDGYRVRRVTLNVLPTEMLVSQMKLMVLNLLNTNLRNRGKLRPYEDYILVYDGHILVEDHTLQENQLASDQAEAVFHVRLCTRDDIDSTYYEQRLVEKKTARAGRNLNAVPRSHAPQAHGTTAKSTAPNGTPHRSHHHDSNTHQQSGARADPSTTPSKHASSSTGSEPSSSSSSSLAAAPTASDADDKKPKKKRGPEVRLRIQETVDGNQIGCDISASARTRFRKIASMYCAHRGYQMGDYIFACDGILMEDTKTLASLGLDNPDQVYLINVFHHSIVNIEE